MAHDLKITEMPLPPAYRGKRGAIYPSALPQLFRLTMLMHLAVPRWRHPAERPTARLGLKGPREISVIIYGQFLLEQLPFCRQRLLNW